MEIPTVTIPQLLGVLSFVTFIGSLLAVPFIINRMKPDYFVRHWQEKAQKRRYHPGVALTVLLFRNCMGILLFLAGVLMLVLPGQGILTMIIGVCVMDFSKKEQLLKKIVSFKKTQQLLNWIRRKEGKKDFIFP